MSYIIIYSLIKSWNKYICHFSLFHNLFYFCKFIVNLSKFKLINILK